MLGIEIAEKTNGYYVLAICYGAIIDYYAELRDFKRAEEYEVKMMNLFESALDLKNNKNAVAAKLRGEISLYRSKGNYERVLEIALTLKKDLEGQKLQEAGLTMGIGKSLVALGRKEEGENFIQLGGATIQGFLDELEHASLQTAIMAPKEIDVGEVFDLRLDFIGLKKPITLLKISGLQPKDFEIKKLPSYCKQVEGQIEIQEKELKSFSVEPLNLSLQITRPGEFNVCFNVEYKENSEEIKNLSLKPFLITARSIMRLKIGDEVMSVPILPNRVSTGYSDLDTIMYGGIPEGYSIILSSPSIDERELLIKRFLETGAHAGEITYYITSQLNLGKTLAEKYTQNLQLFACSGLADSVIKNLPNVSKLKGTENLTDIDIALTKALRSINQANTNNKRICIEIISDVLLQHHALITRKWLSGMLPMLKNKGFTILGVINPQMHTQEETQAIQGLFEGEIKLSERETNNGMEKTLRIRKLYNQKYIENEILLHREKLE